MPLRPHTVLAKRHKTVTRSWAAGHFLILIRHSRKKKRERLLKGAGQTGLSLCFRNSPIYSGAIVNYEKQGGATNVFLIDGS